MAITDLPHHPSALLSPLVSFLLALCALGIALASLLHQVSFGCL